MKSERDKPNMISYHRSLKKINWKRHLAIEVQSPGIIYQVKLKILKLLIFLKQNSRLSIENTF
jgi:hypothetical protein